MSSDEDHSRMRKEEIEIAENYRRQIQESEARKRQWVENDHTNFLKWIAENTQILIRMAIESGTAATERAAAEAVAAYQAEILKVSDLSPYDDFNAYLIMRRLIGEIERACARLEVSTPGGVVFGIAPMLGLQAHQSSVLATNASIIGISPAFLPFCDLLSSLLALSLTIDLENQTISNAPEDFQLKIEQNPDLFDFWERTLLHFALYGWPPPKEGRPLTIAEGRVRVELLRAIELFSFGHEYGHHNLQHGTPQPLGERSDSVQQELEADFFGQAIAKVIGRTEKPSPNLYAISGVGGVSILSALQLIRRMRSVLTKGSALNDSPTSHPPLADRIEAILAVHENEGEQAQWAMMCDCFSQIFDMLWERIEPRCKERHHRGVRPHEDVLHAGGWLPLGA